MKGVWVLLGCLSLVVFLAQGIKGDGWDLTRLALGCTSLLLADAMHDRDKKAAALREARRTVRTWRP